MDAIQVLRASLAASPLVTRTGGNRSQRCPPPLDSTRHGKHHRRSRVAPGTVGTASASRFRNAAGAGGPSLTGASDDLHPKRQQAQTVENDQNSTPLVANDRERKSEGDRERRDQQNRHHRKGEDEILADDPSH